jgi:hypothetical protein
MELEEFQHVYLAVNRLIDTFIIDGREYKAQRGSYTLDEDGQPSKTCRYCDGYFPFPMLRKQRSNVDCACLVCTYKREKIRTKRNTRQFRKHKTSHDGRLLLWCSHHNTFHSDSEFYEDIDKSFGRSLLCRDARKEKYNKTRFGKSDGRTTRSWMPAQDHIWRKRSNLRVTRKKGSSCHSHSYIGY